MIQSTSEQPSCLHLTKPSNTYKLQVRKNLASVTKNHVNAKFHQVYEK